MKNEIESLIGHRIVSVRWDTDRYGYRVLRIGTDSFDLVMEHERDCCNQGDLIDGFDDLKQMVGEVVLEAECVKQDGVEGQMPDWADYLNQWTFYKIRTMNTSATLRWFATSNGYYSVEVPCRVEPK